MLDCRRAARLMLAKRMDLSPLLTLDLPLASGVSAFGKLVGRDQLKVTLLT